MNADSLIEGTGGCGAFQVMMAATVATTKSVVAWGMLFMAFGNYNPGWSCLDQRPAINDSGLYGGNNSVLVKKNSSSGNISLAYSPESDNNVSENDTSEEKCDVFATCRNIEFDPDSSTIVSEWGLVCDKDWVPSVIISIQMVGLLIGCCVAGQLGDRVGRKITTYGYMTLYTLANFIAIFSVSWQMFAAIRFFIGFGVGGIFTTCFVYPLEYMNYKWRAVLGAIPFWSVGTTGFAIMVMILKDWRHLHIASAVIGLVSIFPVFWVPESMRWLAVKGRMNKAERVVQKMAYWNKTSVPDTTILYDIAKEEKERYSQGGAKYTYLDLFKTSRIRSFSIRLCVVWMFMAVVYYTIQFGIKSLSGDFYLNLVLSTLLELPAFLFLAPLADRLGRRWACVLSSCVAFTSCFVLVIVFFTTEGGVKTTAIFALAMLAKMSLLLNWYLVILFCSELYPTVVRNLGLGFFNASARIGNIVAPYLIPKTQDVLYISFIIMGVLCLTICLLLFSLPETNKNPLEDTITRSGPQAAMLETDVTATGDGLLPKSEIVNGKRDGHSNGKTAASHC